MDAHLAKLVEKARTVRMSSQDIESQRRSFAYGNTKIENDDITREIVDEAAQFIQEGRLQVVDVAAAAEVKRD